MKAKIKLDKYINNCINISGSKNSSLPIICASILCDEIVILKNVPLISDVFLLINILKDIGYQLVLNKEDHTLTIYPSIINKKYFHNSKITKLRGSYYLIGCLIAKNNKSDFSFLHPGGCKLGTRPINYHINAFKNMGLDIKTNNKVIKVKGQIHECIHYLDYPSVGTTINIILASSKLEKESIIYNASIEPEVIDLCEFLKSMGVNITITNRIIKIKGNKYLSSTKYKIMEDRIEAGTFLILGALHQGITVNNINPSNLSFLTDLLISCGYKLKITSNSITLLPFKKEDILPFNITLEPHPGFPTDLGPLMCVLASQINGISYIKETVFKDRFSHIDELKKMNIDISLNNNTIIIKGISNVCNSQIKAQDLRCAASLLLSASISSELSTIENIDYLFRGYENIKYKLASLGIDFTI